MRTPLLLLPFAFARSRNRIHSSKIQLSNIFRVSGSMENQIYIYVWKRSCCIMKDKSWCSLSPHLRPTLLHSVTYKDLNACIIAETPAKSTHLLIKIYSKSFHFFMYLTFSLSLSLSAWVLVKHRHLSEV